MSLKIPARSLAALAVMAGCASPQISPEVASVTAAADESLVWALSVRDPAPDCAAVAAGYTGDAPLADALMVVAEQVSQPAWASLRAARCLAELAPASGRPALERWVVEEAYAGLGRAVLGQLGEMPAAVAQPVLRSALGGKLDTIAREHAIASARPELMTVITEEH